MRFYAAPASRATLAVLLICTFPFGARGPRDFRKFLRVYRDEFGCCLPGSKRGWRGSRLSVPRTALYTPSQVLPEATPKTELALGRPR